MGGSTKTNKCWISFLKSLKNRNNINIRLFPLPHKSESASVKVCSREKSWQQYKQQAVNWERWEEIVSFAGEEAPSGGRRDNALRLQWCGSTVWIRLGVLPKARVCSATAEAPTEDFSVVKSFQQSVRNYNSTAVLKGEHGSRSKRRAPVGEAAARRRSSPLLERGQGKMHAWVHLIITRV